MKAFAELLDRLAYEPRRTAKIRLVAAYFRATPDPDRGYALAAMTGALSFANAKPGLVRALAAERVDPVLFGLSYDYVGDLSETVALIWPGKADGPSPALAEVVETLASLSKSDLPARLALWLDRLDETGRWALLKLITGALRIGVSARLAKTGLAELGNVPVDEIEELWPGLKPPYAELFAFVEGRGPRPETGDPAPFRPAMLAHALEETEVSALDPRDFAAEWKWDGIRVQVVSGRAPDGRLVRRLYSRTGEDVSTAFPDILEAVDFEGVIDGELLIRVEDAVQSFQTLQQRLNRKRVSPTLIASHPAHVRAYDLLVEGGADLRALPFGARRERLERFIAALNQPRIDLSPLVPFADWQELAAARVDPSPLIAGPDVAAIEGLMLKRLDSPYLPGRPKGHWYKWKRDPFTVDAVLMYAQRGHGKRSSFYSDFTFGVWQDGKLVPVGKAYFGFSDAELAQLDAYVRRNTTNRFGPVREVAHGLAQGLVLEIAFEGLQESSRHRSGVAMRFPRVARIRWDKPPSEADTLQSLRQLIRAGSAPVLTG